MTTSQSEGFLALPPSGKGPAVLVLHAWWGLNDTIKSVCTRLADAGFVAFAADLYHGRVATTIPEAEALGGEIDANFQQVRAEVAEAAKFLSERAGRTDLAVVAFSLGAYFALDLSVAHPELVRDVVVFYGTHGTMPMDFSKSKAAYLGHFAENDPYEPPSNADNLEQALKSAGRPVTIYRYAGTGHWFFEPDRTDAYNPAAANLAWDRTLSFLKQPQN
jgi:carboxymethylenebutenolidase